MVGYFSPWLIQFVGLDMALGVLGTKHSQCHLTEYFTHLPFSPSSKSSNETFHQGIYKVKDFV